MQTCTCIAILNIAAKSELHNGFYGWLLCNKVSYMHYIPFARNFLHRLTYRSP